MDGRGGFDPALFGVSPADPLTYGSVGALLLTIAMLATWVPARRPSRVETTKALRTE
jgi:ABC-type lipoprotein release transport system permease subunit